MFSTKNSNLKALNLLEMVIAIAFIAIIFTAGFRVFAINIDAVNRSRQSTLAELLVQDLIELTISKRNEGWLSLIPGQYYFVEDPDPAVGYIFAPGQETVGEFTRSVTIAEVRRDASGNIVSAGGTVDPNTFYLEAVASWSNNGVGEEVRLYQYITNWNGF